MKSMNANKIISVIIALISIAYIWMAYQIPQFPIPRPVDSDLFPKVLGFSLLILSILLFFDKTGISDAPAETVEGDRLPWYRRPTMKVVVTSVAIAAYALLLVPVGFVLASLSLCFGLALYYGYRNHLVNFVSSFGVVIVLYLMMTRVMEVYLPKGIIPF